MTPSAGRPARSPRVPRLTVIGVGNPYGGDDAAGVAVVGALAQRWRTRSEVQFVLLDGEPTRLVDAWRSGDEVWVLDAMMSGRPAGTLEEVDADRVAELGSIGRAGTHGTGIGEAIALGRALDVLPGTLRVFGIEGVAFGPGPGLSPALATAIGRVVDALDDAVRDRVADVGPPTSTRAGSLRRRRPRRPSGRGGGGRRA